MNVAVIGSGGREHALAFKLSQSKSLSKLFIIPGNPGTENLGIHNSIDISDHSKVIEFCKNEKIDLVVIGPEQPLVDGLANSLRNSGINVFGPDKAAAAIEGDKVFSKTLMKKYNIPTAEFEVFEKSDYEITLKYLDEIDYPVVVKASGLAAGKGVLICSTREEAVKAVDNMFNNDLFGTAGHEIVIEEFMVGLEASIFAITDGDDYYILPTSQDHKRAFDNDKGKNTGGMGAYAPAPLVTDELLKEIEEKVIVRTLDAMKESGRKYNGCLYAGLMITKEGPKVVEFNCRFGDPEAQVVLPIIEGDFLKLLYSAAIGSIDKNSVSYSGACAICVVLASGGYPDAYEKGKIIKGLDNLSDPKVVVYHAGTKRVNENIVTNGGRVLGITQIDKSGNLNNCKEKVYTVLSKIHFDNMYYRKDISNKANITTV